ncbi:MAG: hypothetical protein J8272_00825, partial ['Prunus persica' phytoplasma PP2]|nr:hypothetical protein ['Prunus persica' phytoplasma PP2]
PCLLLLPIYTLHLSHLFLQISHSLIPSQCLPQPPSLSLSLSLSTNPNQKQTIKTHTISLSLSTQQAQNTQVYLPFTAN